MNPLTLQQPFARTNAFYYSFVPHTVSLWNSLSYSQVTAASLASFKTTYLVYLAPYVVLFCTYHLCYVVVLFVLVLVSGHALDQPRWLLYVLYMCTNFYKKNKQQLVYVT